MNNLYMEILENNIKFKELLHIQQEEIVQNDKKNEISLQLTLLYDILEGKIREMEKMGDLKEFQIKLINDTSQLLQKFRKSPHKSPILLKFPENSPDNFEDNYDQNVLEDDNMLEFDEIPYDQEEEIKKMLADLQNLNKISKETAEIIAKNSENFDLIEVEADQSKLNTEKVVKELKVAAKETIKKRKNYLKIFFATLGGLIGIQAGPVGVGVGAIGGGAVGGVVSLGLNPLNNKINKIDEKK